MSIITKYYARIPGQKRKIRERYVVDENGAKRGLYQSYYRNGQDKVTCTYKNDVRHGHYVSKHPNGRVATECDYDEGALEGRFIRLDKMGRILFDGNFHRNLGEGRQVYYRADGSVLSQEQLHLGRRNGECVSWCPEEVERKIFQNGITVQIPQFSTGRITKMVQEFADDVMINQVDFVYNAEQVLEEKVEYSRNSKLARHTYYFPNGQKRLVCSQNYDSMEGPYTRFFESGRKAEEGVCVRNQVHGRQVLYYDNEANSKKEESHFVKGQLDGICVRRDENGKVIEKCRYEKGKRVIYRGMSEVLFNKKAEQEIRDSVAQDIVEARQQGQKEKAVLLARQFHSEQSDIPRRTALKLNQENCRS